MQSFFYYITITTTITTRKGVTMNAANLTRTIIRYDPTTRITGFRLAEIGERVRQYGILRLAAQTGKSYSTISQKVNGFQFLYEQDIEEWEKIMSQ
jgi:hypothetical protein